MDHFKRRKSIDALSSDITPIPQKACKVFGEWQPNLDAADSATKTRKFGSVLRKMTGIGSTRSRNTENTPTLLRTRLLSDHGGGPVANEKHPRHKHSVKTRRSCEGLIDAVSSFTHQMPKTSPIEGRSLRKNRRSTDSLLAKRTEYLQRLHEKSSKVTKTKKKSPLTKSSLKRTPAMRKSPNCDTVRIPDRTTPRKSTVKGLVVKTNVEKANVSENKEKMSTLKNFARRLRRRSVDDLLDEQKTKRQTRRSLDILDTSETKMVSLSVSSAANVELSDESEVNKTSRRGPRCGVNMMSRSPHRLRSPRRPYSRTSSSAAGVTVKRMRNRILTNGLLKNAAADVCEIQRTPVPLPRRRRKTRSSAALLSPH